MPAPLIRPPWRVSPTPRRHIDFEQALGGNTTAYAYPQDPVNGADLDGRWPSWLNWRNVGKAAAIAGGVAGAIACGVTIVCGVAVGAASAGAYYAAANAGARSWTLRGQIGSVATGAIFGRLQNVGRGILGARLFGSRMFGVASSRFARSRVAGFTGSWNKGAFRVGWGWQPEIKNQVSPISWSTPARRTRGRHIDLFWNR